MASELEMLGVDCLGGQDGWMDVAKGAAGFLSGAGGLMSGGASSKKNDATDAERRRLEEAKQKAEADAVRARRNLAVGGVAAAAVALTAAVFFKRKSV